MALTVLLDHAVPPVATNVVGVWQHVHDILLLVCLPLVEPEQATADERDDGDGSVVPD